MDYSITIDRDGCRIVTKWGPAASDASLMSYQKTVWSDPSIQGFDELIDFREVEQIEVTSGGLRAVAAVAAAMDQPELKSRFAIVVDNPLSFGLARMYEIFRSLEEQAVREVSVFQDIDPALAWLDGPS